MQKEVFPIADKMDLPSGKQADGVVFCRLLQRMGMMWFFVMLFLSDRGVSFGKYLTENVFLRFNALHLITPILLHLVARFER